MHVAQKRCMHCATSRASLITPARTVISLVAANNIGRIGHWCQNLHTDGAQVVDRCSIPRQTAHRVSSSNSRRSSVSFLCRGSVRQVARSGVKQGI